jgi:hypothetical protein
MKSSSLLRRATRVSHQRITRWPPTSSRVSTAAAFSVARPMAQASSSALEFKAGIKTSRGTTAKSWNSNTPMTRLPCSLSSSSLSDIIFTTMAVELMAMAPPSTTEPCHDMRQVCCVTAM